MSCSAVSSQTSALCLRSDRSSTISLDTGVAISRKTLIRIQIIFPSFYPHAQPSFVFLSGTTVDQERQILLKRTLSHIATFYSMRGQPCLKKLVLQLIILQRTLDAEAEARARARADGQVEPEAETSPKETHSTASKDQDMPLTELAEKLKSKEVEADTSQPTFWTKIWSMVASEDQASLFSAHHFGLLTINCQADAKELDFEPESREESEDKEELASPPLSADGCVPRSAYCYSKKMFHTPNSLLPLRSRARLIRNVLRMNGCVVNPGGQQAFRRFIL